LTIIAVMMLESDTGSLKFLCHGIAYTGQKRVRECIPEHIYLAPTGSIPGSGSKYSRAQQSKHQNKYNSFFHL